MESCELWYEHNMVVSDAMHTTRMAGRDGARGSEMGRRRRGSAAALLAGAALALKEMVERSALAKISGMVTMKAFSLETYEGVKRAKSGMKPMPRISSWLRRMMKGRRPLCVVSA